MDDPTQQQAPDPADVEAALAPAVVSHCSTLNEAQMVVSLLASFGIQARIDSENYYRMLGSMAQGFGGIRVHVRQADAEAALEILEQGPEGGSIERLP
jgi:hypothetical protein